MASELWSSRRLSTLRELVALAELRYSTIFSIVIFGLYQLSYPFAQDFKHLATDLTYQMSYHPDEIELVKWLPWVPIVK